ncbi:hypothetical protein [Methylogaea oryzae]|uniref:hypothetical protein n=1 Tax=Methylogaea oryzae TaxID=1295382 RepID=UPI001C3F197A|nr:hypothetical protein [Methylogaea oryzae]
MSEDGNDFELPNDAFEPVRQRVDVQVGNFVRSGDTVYRIAQVLDFESVVAVGVESGRSVPLRIGDLRPVDAKGAKPLAADISTIADEDWKVAEQRFAAIKPLANELYLAVIKSKPAPRRWGLMPPLSTAGSSATRHTAPFRR